MVCTHCGADLSRGASFCGECGQPVPEPAEAQPSGDSAELQTTICANCGAALVPVASFCSDCGQPVDAPAEPLAATCAACGAALISGASFCGDCGQPIPATLPGAPGAAQTCTYCGAVLLPGASFCGDCGQPVAGPARPLPLAAAPAAAPPARRPWLWLLALAGGLALVAALVLAFVLAPRFRDRPGEVIQVVVTSTPTPTVIQVVVTSTPTPTTIAAETPMPAATPVASQPAVSASDTPGPGLLAAATVAGSPAASPETGIVIILEVTEVVTDARPTEPVAPPTNTAPAATAVPLPTATVPPPTAAQVPPTPTPEPPPQAAGPSTGRLAFTSNRDGNPEIYVADLAAGTTRRITNNPANEWLADWSPDGTRLAFTSNRRDGNYDTWTTDSSGGDAQIWVSTDAWDEYPSWSPDGQRLAFASTAQTEGVPNSEIFVRQANGDLQRLTFTQAENQWPDWSPDGRIVYNQGFKGTSAWGIWIISASGGEPQAWLAGPSPDIHPTWSPDGKWLAFIRVVSDSNGNGSLDQDDAGDVWVGAPNGAALRRLTSGLWAATPAWSPDSRFIAFAHSWDSNGDGRIDGQDAANISAVPLAGGEPVSLVASPHRDSNPTWTR